MLLSQHKNCLVGMKEEVESIDNPKDVHELELAIKRYLYGILLNYGNQYNVGSFA